MNRLQSTVTRTLLALGIAGLALLTHGGPAHAASYSTWGTSYTLVDDADSQYYTFNSDDGLQPGDSVQVCITVHGIWNNRLWFYAEDGDGTLVSGEYHVHKYCSWYRIPADGELYVFLDNSDGRLSRAVTVRYRYYFADHDTTPYQAPAPAPTATPQTSTTTQTYTYWNGTSTIVCTYSTATRSCRAQ